MTNDVKETLAERGKRYGTWADNARVSQTIKRAMESDSTRTMPTWAVEGLTMIGQKIARILNGDPCYADNWHDIAGYATLCEAECSPMPAIASEPEPPRRETFWYLATPYTRYPAGRQQAAFLAADVAAKLVEKGIKVFAPIAHSHPISECITQPIENPHRFWLDLDAPFIEAAHGLIVVMAPSWERSAGIAEEIEKFSAAEKPIVWLSIPIEANTSVVWERLRNVG